MLQLLLKCAVQPTTDIGVDTPDGQDPVFWLELILHRVVDNGLLHIAMHTLCGTVYESWYASEQVVLVQLLLSACGYDADGVELEDADDPCELTPELLIDVVKCYDALCQPVSDSMDGAESSAAASVETTCARCGASDTKLLRCSICKGPRYCSVECQRNHWAEHKPLCKPHKVEPPTLDQQRHMIHTRLTLEAKLGLLQLLAVGLLKLRTESVWDAELEAALAGVIVPRACADVAMIDCLSSPSTTCPRGFKAIAMRVFSNAASHGATAFKDAVLTHGTVGVVLNQCKVDPHHPMLREWALFAVKHLCEDHPGIQDVIASMKAVSVAQTPELAALGVKAELDGDGKVRISKPSSK